MTFNSYDGLFQSEAGERIYSLASRAVRDFSMHDLLSRGVLVGFSGGADSVLLLLFLNEYKKRALPSLKITAFHVNHGIRGEEAERDENFSRGFAEGLGIEFISFKCSVPGYAKENSLGLEEAARKLRYNAFFNAVNERDDLAFIATAHNASDNVETVIFNLLRGTGTRGLSGIPPVRDNVIRPLLYLSKQDIREFLTSNKIEFVTDSTNFSSDYTRNYIRNEIVPKFKKLNEEPEKTVTRMCANLRTDAEFIDSYAEDFFEENCRNDKLPIKKFNLLHEALRFRVLSKFAERMDVLSFEYTHFKSIDSLLKAGGNFKISLPSGKVFRAEYDFCVITENAENEDFSVRLHLGLNEIPGFTDSILISDKKIDISSSKVYKFSIQAKLKFDIINEALFVRSKKDGDEYRYSSMTRKLKKLFGAAKIPERLRKNVPVFADKNGVIWVPGFGISESLNPDNPTIYIYILDSEDSSCERKFFIPKIYPDDMQKG